jgi:hypothetical protein
MMIVKFRMSAVLTAITILLNASSARSELIIGGSAVISLTTSPTNGAFADRFFVGDDAATLTRSQILDAAANPGVPFDRSPGGVSMAINGSSLTQPAGRVRQTTNLEFAPSGTDIAAFLASWTPATPGAGSFGPNLTGGERVGLDSVLRFNSLLGVAVLGEFALQYNPASGFGEGLTLSQNFDANAIVWLLDIDDATFTSSASGFSFSADMLTTPGPAGFVGLDSNAGRFSINAITAIPEPSSLALLGMVSVGLLRRTKGFRHRGCV